MPSRLSQSVRLLPCLMLLGLACHPASIAGITVDGHSRTVTAMLGQEVRITLWAVGPGEYEAPPQVTSPILAFITASYIPPYTPGGANQEFRFAAEGRGRAIVHFRRVLNDSLIATVEDTVDVR